MSSADSEEITSVGRFLTHTMWEMQPTRQDVAVLAAAGAASAASLAPAQARRSQTRCSCDYSSQKRSAPAGPFPLE